MTRTRLDILGTSCSLDDALALFDALDAVRAEEITGRWRGRELRTGHPMDGALEASGWYGKQFDGVDDVHPLLFRTPGGQLVSLDPRRVPLGLADQLPRGAMSAARRTLGITRVAMATRKPRARLRNVEFRGVVTAAMVYDHLPIIDVFRRVDADTLLGVMDLRDSAPYVFVLERD
ncbi:DUF4334 domain-containing protein [Nocardioides jiangxiensis]|uniref:DUF4334 domain-containing protein n=1 Tax=Nocardioides jiangxiensis TaxID=3064524 RepID=A0ABT9AX26_9ACTN|nr:DUF4334 domain-containing protein [Nocardioides sp. WY-20]MDO7867066.1 DUF4334 domain-containing protein [Nocardioides sp. WY-20]